MNEMKQEQRRLALTRRRNMTAEERQRADMAICQRMLSLPELQQAQVIMSYAAMPEEVNLMSLHEWLWQQGKTVVFPVTDGDGIMHTVAATPKSHWQTGAYGIREPIGKEIMPDAIDLVIAPCVAFDGGCHRLGHGGGYYDRFLRRCPRASCVAAAFEAQRLDEVCTDSYDYPPQKVVTECAIYERTEKESSDGSDREESEK